MYAGFIWYVNSSLMRWKRCVNSSSSMHSEKTHLHTYCRRANKMGGVGFFFSVTRLKVTSQEVESYRREQTVWETKLGELQARCTTLEDEKYEALAKVRESVQMAEDAALQKDQVTVLVSLSTTLSSAPFLKCFSQAKSSLQSVKLNDPRANVRIPSAQRNFACLQMCVWLYALPSGLVKRETEDRRTGEDKGGHQTADPGCCGPHQKRGGEFHMALTARCCGLFCRSWQWESMIQIPEW